MARIVFVHAHPDDEAIFTGGTIARLCDLGHDVRLIIATGGELGSADGDGVPLATKRADETRASCQALSLDPSALAFLPFEDSGMSGENGNGLAHQPLHDVASALIATVDEPVDAIVGYDERGIYGHPDHIAVYDVVHHVGARLLTARGDSPTIYDTTVDREYLHFVETHLVVDAGGGRPQGRGLAATDLGLATLDIDVAIDVNAVLDRKRAAMAAHASQLPADAPLFELGKANFAAVYGYEWYRRTGPRTALDDL